MARSPYVRTGERSRDIAIGVVRWAPMPLRGVRGGGGQFPVILVSKSFS